MPLPRWPLEPINAMVWTKAMPPKIAMATSAVMRAIQCMVGSFANAGANTAPGSAGTVRRIRRVRKTGTVEPCARTAGGGSAGRG